MNERLFWLYTDHNNRMICRRLPVVQLRGIYEDNNRIAATDILGQNRYIGFPKENGQVELAEVNDIASRRSDLTDGKHCQQRRIVHWLLPIGQHHGRTSSQTVRRLLLSYMRN